MTVNAYEKYAEVMVFPRKKSKVRVVKSDSDAPLVLRGAAKELAQNAAQLRRYQRFLVRERQELLAADEEVRELFAYLKRMTIDSAAELLAFMEERDWYRHMTVEQRATILHLIDTAICRLRISNGLPPIDDSIFDEPPTVFDICRKQLGVNNA